MSKRNVLSFRPTTWEDRAVAAAENATGFKPSELLRRCVATALQTVVREALSEHSAAVAAFEDVIKESPAAAGAPTVPAQPVTGPYKLSRKPKGKVA